MWNVLCLRMLMGAVFLTKIIEADVFVLIALGCLILYGLALINGSKFTFGVIHLLRYGMIVLGLINRWFDGLGLYFLAAGFGLLHILYGLVMWNKYERI